MVMTFIISGSAVLLATRIFVEQRKSSVLTKKNWDDLIAELEPTATSQITLIAIEFLNPDQTAFKTDPSSLLSSLGGVEGVKKMRRNADLLIALAGQAERWNPQTTRNLVAQMREDGGELRRAALLLSLGLLNTSSGRGRRFIQQAAAAYYRMMYRLLDSARQFSPNNLSSLNNALYS